MSTEFQRIARFTSAFPNTSPSVIAGPGDDCALTQPRPGRYLVSKVDQIVEGVHFTDVFLPAEVGHKALAVALSDLAAAGAEPRWFLVALALPDAYPDRALSALAKGMSRLATLCDVSLIGGNFTRADQLSIAVTTLGEVKPAQALRRSGARAGDVLVVTGTLGEAALGVSLLAGGRPGKLSPAMSRQLAPVPRHTLGPILGKYVHAAIDVSDGLLQDLGHLCERSGVGAEIDTTALPLGAEVARLGSEGLQLGLSGGEDYELLAAVDPSRLRGLQAAARRRGVPLTTIGRIVEEGGIRLLGPAGEKLPLPKRRGFEHFA